MRHRVISDDGYATDHSDSSLNGEPISDLDNEQTDFGILFDVDGVLFRGSKPLSQAIEAMKYLKDSSNHFRVPVAFVTNGCSPRHKKAASLSQGLNVEVNVDNVIIAPSPCAILTEFHKKHVLVIGQDNRKEIAEDLGFDNLCFIEDIQDAYPLLDIVSQENRRILARGYTEKKFPKVEAILLLGEPTEWESHLQLLIDLFLTEGVPTKAPRDATNVPQIPVIACNLDLQFMAEACMPRFGHGAFLVCLEALYKKYTGKDLKYSVLVGKPCELTYRYAEHMIYAEAKRLGINRPIKTLYFIGDNHQVDIVGANLYNKYIKNINANRENNNKNANCENNNKNSTRENNNNNEPETSRECTYLPSSRMINCEEQLNEQTVEKCISLLVCTGIYQSDQVDIDTLTAVQHGHRDIDQDVSLCKPTKVVPDVFQAIKYVFEHEGHTSPS